MNPPYEVSNVFIFLIEKCKFVELRLLKNFATHLTKSRCRSEANARRKHWWWWWEREMQRPSSPETTGKSEHPQTEQSKKRRAGVDLHSLPTPAEVRDAVVKRIRSLEYKPLCTLAQAGIWSISSEAKAAARVERALEEILEGLWVGPRGWRPTEHTWTHENMPGFTPASKEKGEEGLRNLLQRIESDPSFLPCKREGETQEKAFKRVKRAYASAVSEEWIS